MKGYYLKFPSLLLLLLLLRFLFTRLVCVCISRDSTGDVLLNFVFVNNNFLMK